jgi:serine 3-dehydrogenase
VTTLELDVRDLGAMAKAVGSLTAELGEFDLPVNNAGTAYRSPLQDADIGDVYAVIDTNITAMVALTRLLLPGLIAKRGAIINVSSTAANYPHGRSIAYGASKSFISHFSTGLRSDLHGTGVRVTTIEPGRAEAMYGIAQLPPHVNVNKRELMPISQSLAGYQFLAAERPNAEGRPA